MRKLSMLFGAVLLFCANAAVANVRSGRVVRAVQRPNQAARWRLQFRSGHTFANRLRFAFARSEAAPFLLLTDALDTGAGPGANLHDVHAGDFTHGGAGYRFRLEYSEDLSSARQVMFAGELRFEADISASARPGSLRLHREQILEISPAGRGHRLLLDGGIHLLIEPGYAQQGDDFFVKPAQRFETSPLSL